MRLATYNLESLGDSRSGAAALEESIALLRPILNALDADILCLQEVNGQRPWGGGERQLIALERLRAATPYRDFHLASSRGTTGAGFADVHNLVVLSRWPVSQVETLWHRLVPPLNYRPVTARAMVETREPVETPNPVVWDRPLLHAVIDYPGGRALHIVNLHLRAPLAAPVAGQKTGALTWRSLGGWAEGFFIAAMKRSGQALEARLLLERLFDAEPDALVAVCGDCNADLSEVPLKILCGDLEDIDRPELAARQLIAVDAVLPPGRRYSLLHGGRRLMLDHILVSRGLARCHQEVEIGNRGLPDETLLAKDDPRPRHGPLLASFDL